MRRVREWIGVLSFRGQQIPAFHDKFPLSQENAVHPVQQHINSLSQRLTVESDQCKKPDELAKLATRLCGDTLSWLVPRVTKAVLDDGQGNRPSRD